MGDTIDARARSRRAAAKIGAAASAKMFATARANLAYDCAACGLERAELARPCPHCGARPTVAGGHASP